MQTKSGKERRDPSGAASYLDPLGRSGRRRHWATATAVVALFALVTAVAEKGSLPRSISVAGSLATAAPSTTLAPGTKSSLAVDEQQAPPLPPVTGAAVQTDGTQVTTEQATTTTTAASSAAPPVASSVPPPEPFLPPISVPPVGVPPPGARVTLFPVSTPASQPMGMVSGPDGNLWFTEGNRDVVGRVTPEGVITEFHTPTALSQPGEIVVGPDGALWFTEMSANNIGRVTTAGAFAEFPIPTAYSNPSDIAVGPDGALWFTEWNVAKVSRVTLDGHMTEYPAGTPTPNRIVPGVDGDLWFNNMSGVVGRIGPNGVSRPAMVTDLSDVLAVTVDRLGSLWFAGFDQSDVGRIERRDPAGQVTEFVVGPHVEFSGIAEGPDGAMWFTESNMNAIGRVATDGTISTDSVPSPASVVAGPDGNMWFTSGTNGNAVGRIRIR